MKDLLEYIDEAIVKKPRTTEYKPTIAIYKNISKLAQKPKYDSELYYALISDEKLLDNLLAIENIDDFYIKQAFNDRWSESKNYPHNVWLRPKLYDNDSWIFNFFNENKLEKEYKFVENIDIKDFNKTYWVKNYN